MAKAVLKFYENNSQFVKVTGLQDQGTTPATFIDDATLTGTLQDSAGAPQVGANALTGVYVADSDGDYTFAINGTGFDPPLGFGYVFVIEGTYASGTKRFHAEIPANVLLRDQGTET